MDIFMILNNATLYPSISLWDDLKFFEKKISFVSCFTLLRVTHREFAEVTVLDYIDLFEYKGHSTVQDRFV